ncbi:bacillithiol biosynthesis deacetylase BshB1 [Paenibacillus arenosi]|uniref:Bacillithiol biosynthesis deacetylase BshB1 n=1 Tax=Paenibacillus arenosi TaxID=2774142 RepID=A0ABR9AUM6_9BACL|nr:bacillithiol biosynthesis deacetylase BshB1 [Paenibacillus arenosi]MBD8497591.1 bacillithiol biosynthesis deacetylase BshB1 [Paenibacillus arenosi]
MNQVDLLAFGAHPDDVEIGMGGTLAKHQQAGFSIGIVDVTYAEMSSNGTVEVRQLEAKAADEVLGVTFRLNLGLPDRGLKLDKSHVDEVVKAIRTYRPRIVFVPYWEDRHPDHVMCSRIVQEALFNAKLRRYMPELAAHQPEHVYFYFINDLAPADLIVDVTDVYDRKQAALYAYQSQFTSAKSGEDIVATPLNQGYVERVAARDALIGQARGIGFAEGFIYKGPYHVAYLLDRES